MYAQWKCVKSYVHDISKIKKIQEGSVCIRNHCYSIMSIMILYFKLQPSMYHHSAHTFWHTTD